LRLKKSCERVEVQSALAPGEGLSAKPAASSTSGRTDRVRRGSRGGRSTHDAEALDRLAPIVDDELRVEAATEVMGTACAASGSEADEGEREGGRGEVSRTELRVERRGVGETHEMDHAAVPIQPRRLQVEVGQPTRRGETRRRRMTKT